MALRLSLISFMAKPTDIAHHLGDNCLIVTWEDGAEVRYPLPYLRAWCPCAGCQGHGNRTTYLSESQVSAVALEEVGAYALAITFSDGHDTGIYRWSWLRELAPDRPPLGLKRGFYESGRFRSE